MKHIKTPVRVDVEHDDWLPRYRVQIVDEGGTVIFCGSRYNTPEEALADPLANELANTINAPSALVEASEMIIRVCDNRAHYDEIGWDCLLGAATHKIRTALKLVKGETE